MNDIIINTVSAVDFAEIIICTLFSLALGALVAFVYSYKNHASRNFLVALSLLPAMIQVVIMMVNGNIGAGLAVAGAFTMVRFRSVTGNAKDITHVFFAVAIGLSTGMGELLFAVIFTVIICIVLFSYSHFDFGQSSKTLRQLKLSAASNEAMYKQIEIILQNHNINFELEQTEYPKAKLNTPDIEPDTVEYTFTITLRDEVNEREVLRELREVTGSQPATIRPVPYNKEKL
jgi:uncharacterized membrane protein YhiD involved in acid resistance